MKTTLILACLLLVAGTVLAPTASAHIEACVGHRYVSVSTFELVHVHDDPDVCDDPGPAQLKSAPIIKP